MVPHRWCWPYLHFLQGYSLEGLGNVAGVQETNNGEWVSTGDCRCQWFSTCHAHGVAQQAGSTRVLTSSSRSVRPGR